MNPIKVIRKTTESEMSVILDFSPIKGPEGNIEYLAHLEKTEEVGTLADVSIDWKQIVENAFETLSKS